MEHNIPASWIQDAIIENMVKTVVDQIALVAEGNTVTSLVKAKGDGSVAVVWSWKPAGASKLSDVRRGEVSFTPEAALLAYADVLRPPKKRK